MKRVPVAYPAATPETAAASIHQQITRMRAQNEKPTPKRAGDAELWARRWATEDAYRGTCGGTLTSTTGPWRVKDRFPAGAEWRACLKKGDWQEPNMAYQLTDYIAYRRNWKDGFLSPFFWDLRELGIGTSEDAAGNLHISLVMLEGSTVGPIPAECSMASESRMMTC